MKLLLKICLYWRNKETVRLLDNCRYTGVANTRTLHMVMKECFLEALNSVLIFFHRFNCNMFCVYRQYMQYQKNQTLRKPGRKMEYHAVVPCRKRSAIFFSGGLLNLIFDQRITVQRWKVVITFQVEIFAFCHQINHPTLFYSCFFLVNETTSIVFSTECFKDAKSTNKLHHKSKLTCVLLFLTKTDFLEGVASLN